MKISTKPKKTPDQPVIYPAHFKNLSDNSIILAFGVNTGVIVDKGDGLDEVGVFSYVWSNFEGEFWTRIKHKTTFED